jgi:exodeoxyribonuclease VII large subunit
VNQPGLKLFAGAPFGVAELTEYLRKKFWQDERLRSCAVRGEVSGYSVQRKGHLNFKLKEGTAVLSCFAFADDWYAFPAFADGAALVASGELSTNPWRGEYQLTVRKIALDGVGDAHAIFEERKRRLEVEGLFRVERKRPLPTFPFRVALVSSPMARGAGDFVARLRALRPHVAIEWCETSVQGANAPREIVGALARASQRDVDLVVLTRGGGSFEDLFSFSDEQVVRAVVAVRHPVISAIGHTVDQQLCDFAADAHAATPSAAAERVGFETRALAERSREAVRRIYGTVERRILERETVLQRTLIRSPLADPRLVLETRRRSVAAADESLAASFVRRLGVKADALEALRVRVRRFDPSSRLVERAGRLRVGERDLRDAVRRTVRARFARIESAWVRLAPAAIRDLERHAVRLELAKARLDGKSPEAILQRGYAIVEHDGRIVRDSASVPLGASIKARLGRGTLRARVEAEGLDGNERIG